MLSKRDSFLASEATRLGNLAQHNVVASPQFQSARSVGLYCSIGSEIPTDVIVQAAREGGKKISLPRIEGHMIRFYEYNTGDVLVKGRFGVMEPLPAIPAAALDLAIIPGVVFDTRGCRIGYGKGFYDRFLATKQASFSMGLAYSFQVVEGLPRGRFDKKLDALATDDGVIYF